MQRIFRIHIAVAGFWAALLGGGALAAPVALVLDIAGAKGGVEAFSEIEPGTKIDLGRDGRLEFLDYNSCKTITIIGGRISFTERRFLLRGGKQSGAGRGRCPKVVSLDQDARVGGVLLRANPPTLRLKARPRFAFTGPRGGTVNRIRILKPDGQVLRLRLKKRLLEWPPETAALPVGRHTLEIPGQDGAAAKQLPFEVTATGGKSPLTIIRMN